MITRAPTWTRIKTYDASGGGLWNPDSDAIIFDTNNNGIYDGGGNNPPDKPIIDGPITGKAGVEYTYYANTTDPNGDQVYYKWDWGDNSYSDWLGPYDSGIEIPASHAWSQGSYEIRVKAKDSQDSESVWSDPFPITMPRNKVVNRPFLQFLQNHPNLFPILQLLLQRLGLK